MWHRQRDSREHHGLFWDYQGLASITFAFSIIVSYALGSARPHLLEREALN